MFCSGGCGCIVLVIRCVGVMMVGWIILVVLIIRLSCVVFVLSWVRLRLCWVCCLVCVRWWCWCVKICLVISGWLVM